ncbi:MAG: biotin synthase BioB, partial [Planctomycetia bacterium]|nr:biotin synthase BioB [Planctomycetia bacterium]
KVADNHPLSDDEALAVLQAPAEELPALLFAADTVRRRTFGNKVRLCGIVNARSGSCAEDCTFCAQSAHHKAKVPTYPLIPAEKIIEASREAAQMPITHFGVVTSGRRLDAEEVEQVCEAIALGETAAHKWCASLGALRPGQLSSLRDAGLARYHHNLETAESFFPEVCTTHTFAERLATVRAAKDAGLEVCSGGIFGLGESLEQRVELARCLARERVDSVPLNFLVPIEGTPLADATPLEPLDILRTIAMFRLVCTDAEIKVCAAREQHLRNLQPLIFLAGATGMMVGGYLTVEGRALEDDLRMLDDLQVDYE